MRIGRKYLLSLLTAAAQAAMALPDSASFHLESWPPEASATLGASAQDSVENEILTAYIHVRMARFGGWDGGSGMYVGSQLGRLPQLYQVAASGSERKQVTHFTKRMSTFDVNPDPRKRLLLYSRDAGGDEEFQLGLFDLARGTDHPLACPAGRAEGVLWNDSGSAFAYAHTPKGTDRWDIRIHRLGLNRGGSGKAVGSGPADGDGADSLVLSKPGTWMPMDFSPDGKSLLVQKFVSASEAEIHILDLGTGRLTPLLPQGPPAFADNARFVRLGVNTRARGGRPGVKAWAVCFTSDRDGEFNRLYLVYLARPKLAGLARPQPAGGQAPGADTAYASAGIEVLSPPAPWDVEWVDASPDRSLLVYSLNQDGMSSLYSLDLASPRPDPDKAARIGQTAPSSRSPILPVSRLLAGIPMGLIDGVHFRVTPGRPREFAFTVVGATFPGDAFTYRLDREAAVRWTFSETGGLPSRAFRNPQLIHFPTFDSTGAPPQPRQLPAWLYLPDTAIQDTAKMRAPFPVLLLMHGGPEAQARPGFEAFVQYAAGHLGLAVIQPNVRGSSGYGKSMQMADDGFLRMHSVRDIGALLAWIRTQPNLDTNRVAVAGRSYGGFMALSALIEYGHREGSKVGRAGGDRSESGREGMIRAGISTVGITHFPTFLQKTSGYRRDLRRVEYGDERDPRMAAFLDSISPLTRVDRIGSPLLLCHGRNDPRVPYQESERIFGALKSKGVPVWLLTFEEEGHAFRDQDNQSVHYGIMARFLTKELQLKPSPRH